MIRQVYAATTGLETIYDPGLKLGGSSATFSTLLSPIITNIFILSGIACLFTLMISGWTYINASGDKNKTQQAQNMLNYAIIGIVCIAAAYLITSIFGRLVGIDVFNAKI